MIIITKIIIWSTFNMNNNDFKYIKKFKMIINDNNNWNNHLQYNWIIIIIKIISRLIDGDMLIQWICELFHFQYFGKEEQNFISANEIDNMTLIMPTSASRKATVVPDTTQQTSGKVVSIIYLLHTWARIPNLA